ncbi:unnamed protein product, partial [marine sediment metagenome]
LDRWEIHYDIIGRVTNTGLAVVKEGEKVIGEETAMVVELSYCD